MRHDLNASTALKNNKTTHPQLCIITHIFSKASGTSMAMWHQSFIAWLRSKRSAAVDVNQTDQKCTPLKVSQWTLNMSGSEREKIKQAGHKWKSSRGGFKNASVVTTPLRVSCPATVGLEPSQKKGGEKQDVICSSKTSGCRQQRGSDSAILKRPKIFSLASKMDNLALQFQTWGLPETASASSTQTALLHAIHQNQQKQTDIPGAYAPRHRQRDSALSSAPHSQCPLPSAPRESQESRLNRARGAGRTDRNRVRMEYTLLDPYPVIHCLIRQQNHTIFSRHSDISQDISVPQLINEF